MFEFQEKESFNQREERILAFWQGEKIFQKSLDLRKSSSLFSVYDGPPFATGLPHYGHLLAGTIKDVIPRYKTMKGFYVPRRFGWDCHGLPVENEIEKSKVLSGASSIEAFGIAKFNEECRAIVLRYTEQWEATVNRMGRWVDFQQTFRTMDLSFMESVWWVFGQLYARGLVYEGFKVMPFSAKLGTPLSNFEANLNYKEVDDPSLTVMFAVEDEPHTFFLAWTTTPWTLPSNLALAVHPIIDYVKVKELKTQRIFILAKARLEQYFKQPSEYELLQTIKGESLKGKRYIPLLPYFALKRQKEAFRVITDEFVTTEDGTGIVHMAPAFGEADFYACYREGIELVCPVDQNGQFTEEVPDFAGLFVKDADKEIIRRLKQEGKVFHHGQIRHRYPFCWRSDTPLIYKVVRTWFVAVEKIKGAMIEANKKIHWVPGHIKEGRFGNWLESARDWAISRNRYWGTPIPIWRSEDGEIVVISSVKELEEKTKKKITDIHRHCIDDLSFKENGKTFHRVPEVFDCWFESGSMPYAQNHFPFENKEETLKGFPADFVAEGIDQTRCWFYTLNVLSTAIFNEPAFKNVIVNGIVLAEDGQKMSKRLKNYPDPTRMIEEYGADAIRLFFLNSPAVVAEDLKFSERSVELELRQVLIPFWNSFVFLSTYANIYEWQPKMSMSTLPESDLDRWILSLLQTVILEVTEGLDRYELNQAVGPLVGFIDQLTNWYIRRSRSRFWADVDSKDRRDAFDTLYAVLLTLSQVAAPFIPFLSESIYLQLRKEKDPVSVHLCNYPQYISKWRDEQLEKDMANVQIVVSQGHGLRKEHKLKVRQPLKKAHIIAKDLALLDSLKRQQHLIADELNVKNIQFSDDETGFVTLSIKPNFRILGKKVGPLMGKLQGIIQGFSLKQIHQIMSDGQLTMTLEDKAFILLLEDVAIDRQVVEGSVAATAQGITILLDTSLTEELLLEGLAREIVNKINTMRRENGYEVSDRIQVRLKTTDRVRKVFEKYQDYICHEVLAISVTFGPCEGAEVDLNGEPTVIALERVVSI